MSALFESPTLVSGAVGVLLSVAGSNGFVRQEVLPTIDYYRSHLALPDAAERRERRRGGGAADAASLAELRWSIVTFGERLYAELRPALPFFDTVINASADASLASREKAASDPDMHRGKSVKVWALLHAPYRVSIFLDFDMRPCTPDFASRLVAALGDADIAATNKRPSQAKLAPTARAHWSEEHNSGCLVLNMASPRTRRMLGEYRRAFLGAHPVPVRDQPSLRLALEAAAGFGSGLLSSGVGAEGRLRHVDLDVAAPSLVCRAKVVKVVSCDSGCGLAHKPQVREAPRATPSSPFGPLA